MDITVRARKFRRFAILTTAATYLLIFVGGLVRASGAGLGCPDWPKCFGRWIPPLHAGQLPADIDPALFNFTLAWIEYINRLIGVVIGLLILVTAILALRYFRRNQHILYPSLAAAILVAYQGWQGSQVVASALEPLLITIHMVVAFVIVSLLIYVAQQAYYIEKPHTEHTADYPGKFRTWIAGLWGLTIVQIVLGTGVRTAIDTAADAHPLMGVAGLLAEADPLGYLHGMLGLVTAAAAWYAGTRLLRESRQPSPIVSYGIKVMLGLVTAQVLFGGILVGFGLPNLMRLYHLWTASLFIGTLLLLYAALRHSEGVIHE